MVGGVKLAEEVKDVVDDLAFRNCCGVIGGFCEGVYRASGLLILSGVLADLAGKDEWWLLSVGRSIDVDVLHLPDNGFGGLVLGLLMIGGCGVKMGGD